MPGRIHPSRLPRYTASPVEPAVYEALRDTLPKGYVAWHALRFTYGPHKLFRELDFVILAPERGLLLIEVKGGEDWRREDGHWFRGRRLVRDEGPLEQVLGSNERLRELLREELGPRNVPHTFVAVMFPGMHADRAPTGSDLEGRVLVANDLPHLGARIESIVLRAFPEREPDLPWDRIEAVLHRAWGERWVPNLRLEEIQALRQEELVQLDADQVLLAHDTDVRGRLLVLGGPGTGKSLVARESAKRFAREGLRVRYACFTRALALGMQREGLEAVPIRDFARDMLEANDVGLPDGDPSTWDRTAWNRMMDSAAELVAAADFERPEALVVDEVQDFGDREWAIIDALAPRGTPLVAFGDPSQAILEHAKLDVSRFDVTLRLRHAYRTPDEVLELASEVLATGRTRAADSALIRRESVNGHETVADAVRRVVRQLVDHRVKPGEIAVLSAATTRYMSDVPIGDVWSFAPTCRADDERATDRTVVDTAVRFKGLERAWVVLIDLDELASPEGRKRAHIALTRATVGVVLLESHG